MILENTGRIAKPVEVVYPLVRDRLSEIVPYMPNIERIDVVERQDMGGGRTRVVNQWFAKADVPAVAKKFLKPDVLSWKDLALWDDERRQVEYTLESRLARDLYDARGTNSFRPSADGGTDLTIRCELVIHADRIPGVPKFLARQFIPAIEAFIRKLLEPNLMSLSDGLNRYFDERG